MTWLGKILAVLVLVIALVAVWMTALSYATRTNWKTGHDKYKTALEDSERLRKQEYDASQAQIAQLNAQLAEAKKSSDTSATQNVEFGKANLKNSEDIAALAIAIQNGDITATQIAANYKAAADELDANRKRTQTLETERTDLAIKLQNSLNAQAAAEADARQARSREDEAQKKIDVLTSQVNDFKRSGGGVASSVVENSLNGSPPPLVEGTRGTVMAYQDGQVVVSIGLDAGVGPGAVLDVARYTAGGKYLGTVTVTDAYPKMAVGKFRPASGRAVTSLPPGDRPQVGDRVDKPRGSPTR